MKLLLLLLACLPSFGAVALTPNSPHYNWLVLAGSVRNLSTQITGGTLNTFNWAVSATTGGASASLSCTSNCLPQITVTIGATSGTCTTTGNIGTYAVTSTATVTITATSIDDPAQAATFTINVCANTTDAIDGSKGIIIEPFYRTLYAGQRAQLQSHLVGNVNRNVTWSITASPMGADGTLTDTGNWDTVFTCGAVAGRYTITVTSAATSQTNTATMYCTGNTMPYQVTLNKTEPIDWTVDPNLTGKLYDVKADGTGTSNCGAGSSPCTQIQGVPINTAAGMPAGSVIRIWNVDNTGMSPTRYPEYFQIGQSQTGTPTQPLRVVCVPDSLGNLPIIDGNNATTASTTSTAFNGLALINIWPGGSFHFWQSGPNAAKNIIVEGCHAQNARSSYKYTPPTGGAQASWSDAAAGLRISGGFNVEFIGNDSDNTGNGTFSDSNMNSNAWGGSIIGATWEGNYIHNCGSAASQTHHCMYVQDLLHSIQMNRIDNPIPAMEGSCMKTRSLQESIRYNFIGSFAAGGYGCARMIDMVDLQDQSSYMALESTPTTQSIQGYLGEFVPNITSGNLGTLTVDSSNNLKVTASVHTFVSGDTGHYLQVLSGAGWTPGYYTISSVSGGAAVLSSSPAAVNTVSGVAQVWNCGTSYYCSGDTMGLDRHAGWVEAYQQHFVYGNVEEQASSVSGGGVTPNMNSHHFCGDQDVTSDPGMTNRQGILNYYNNTYWVQNNLGGFGQWNSLIDTGCSQNPYQSPTINIQNDIYWGDSSVSFQLFTYFNSQATVSINATTNILSNANPIAFSAPICGGSTSGHTGSGWSSAVAAWSWPNSSSPCSSPPTVNNPPSIDQHTTGLSSANFLYSVASPFNQTTFAPVNAQNGTALSGTMAKMPVRFQVDPSTQIISARGVPVTSSVGGTIGARDSASGSAPVITSTCPATPAILNQLYSFATTATGAAPVTFATTGIPHGMTFSTSTGLWGGTPDMLSTTSFIITASNLNGTSSPQICSITVISGVEFGHASGGGISPGGE